MRRVIIDYKKLDTHTAGLLIDSYPHGYGDDDIILLKTPGGELIEAVELKTADTIFLVKISKSLSNFIANFEETMEKEMDVKPASKKTAEKEDSEIVGLENDFELDEDDLT